MYYSVTKFFKLLVPPFLSNFYTRVKYFIDLSFLRTFNGKGGMFEEMISKSSHYLEYGSGLSTIYAANKTNASIYSVDTSAIWRDWVKSKVSREITLSFVNLGEVKNFGRPKSYNFYNSFYSYANSPFDAGFNPDLILIDGRFRVFVFCTVLLRAKAGTFIIFDDYVSRDNYHIVESLLPPEEYYFNQAIFKVPDQGSIDFDLLIKLVSKFEFVMD